MIKPVDDIVTHATHHQRMAQFHAERARNAVSFVAWIGSWAGDAPLPVESYLATARHHQSIARFHSERAWVFLLSLLLRDPII